jgi:hypothetical protein
MPKLPWYVKWMAMIFCLPTLIGCARNEEPLPLCEKYSVQMAQTPSGPLFILDLENVKKLAALVQGLNNRTCRLEKPKPEGKVM